jgi:hypothetical protein
MTADNVVYQTWDELKPVISQASTRLICTFLSLLLRYQGLHQINHLLPLRTISLHKPIPKSLHKSPIRNLRLGSTETTQDLPQVPSQALARILFPNRIEIILRKPHGVSNLAFRNLDSKQLCNNTSVAVCYFRLFIYATRQSLYPRLGERNLHFEMGHV